jgi:hypothetical protein
MIGIDPHKATHTAVAVDDNEHVVGEFEVRASMTQAERLCDWADSFDKREWAVESANGLGYLVAQQLVASGETVSTSRRCRRRASPAHGFRPVSKERPERRPIDRDRSVAVGSSRDRPP